MSLKRTAMCLLCLVLVWTAGCDTLSPSSGLAESTSTAMTATPTATPVPVPATATVNQPTSTPTLETIFVDLATPTPSPIPASATADPPAPTPESTATSTPIPDLSPTRLKYVLSEKFGAASATSGIFYCDPDLYPVARADEQGRAAAWLKSLNPTSEELLAILEQAKIPAGSDLSPQQQLLVYREHKLLSAITLTKTAKAYRFGLRTFQIGTGKKLSGMAIEGTITPQGAITVTRRLPARLTCK